MNIGNSKSQNEISDNKINMMHIEKNRVAFSSVIAAIFLTLMKFIVGLWSGSLGIMSEALHSALDFAAAFITWAAVKFSSKPPDKKFNYGRGKIESISALIETILLLVTCIWIIHEAVSRLKSEIIPPVEASAVAFIVMIISIIIDYSRSSALYKVAKKYNSQALMADALHFASDILSSIVVVVGLIFVKAGYPYGDPVAALGVSLLIIAASYRLGMETLGSLMDRAPEGLDNKIEEAIMSGGGVDKISRLRVRSSGSEIFIDANISVSGSLSLERAHEIASIAELNVKNAVSGADVVIHPDPADIAGEPFDRRIIAIANKFKLIKEPHNITFLKFDDGRLAAELHVTVAPELSLKEAHSEITEFENAVLKDMPEINQLNTHIDVVLSETLCIEEEGRRREEIINEIQKIINSMSCGYVECLQVNIRRTGKKIYASIRCAVSHNINMARAHEISDEIEHLIHNRIKEVKYVLVHIEPKSDLSDSISA